MSYLAHPLPHKTDSLSVPEVGISRSMDVAYYVVNGGIKLPVGYRFHPTDEELVLHYLRRKAFGLPLPAYVIPELDVSRINPWSLPGDRKEKMFFFSKQKSNGKEEKGKRSAGSGYWKSVGAEKKIVDSKNNSVVGMRRKFYFSEAKFCEWIMYEYVVVGSANPEMGGENWVVQKIVRRRRRVRRRRTFSRQPNRNRSVGRICETSSCCPSGITEVSSDGRDDESFLS